METLEQIFSLDILVVTLRIAIPIALAAIGGTICERSGVINLGLEGLMLIGALGGVIGSHFTGNAWLGVGVAILSSMVAASIFAVLCLKFKANQIVSGVGLNMVASGFTSVLVYLIWKRDGISGQVAQVENVTIPALSEIPVIGVFFTDQSPFLYMTLAIVLISWYVVYKTKIGLRLRSIGDLPKAALSVGIDVVKYRYICIILSGALAGLGGAFLSIVQSNIFVADMVAGRGYMALAASILGGWNPLGSAIASALFAYAQAVRLVLASLNIPDQFIQMLPYVLTLIVLIVVGKKAKGPEALGKIDD